MDAGAFRWVLVAIAVVLAFAIYLFGQHQARLRKRNEIETFTREEVDSAFVEDEQLRFEMNDLNKVLEDNEVEEILDDFQINPGKEVEKPVDDFQIDSGKEVEKPVDDLQINPGKEVEKPVDDFQIDPGKEVEKPVDDFQTNPGKEVEKPPVALSDPEIYVPTKLADKDEERLISHHLRHGDFRLIVGEEAESAVQHVGLELNAEGLLEYREEGELAFQIASLSEPGSFFDIDELNFVTLGFNCFIDLDSCESPSLAYESMLKKIDELVRILNLKVYKSNYELLTISDVTKIREKLA